MTRYKTFKRSATNFKSLSGRKMTHNTGLTLEQARQECEEFNKNRTSRQIRKGTKLEFTLE